MKSTGIIRKSDALGRVVIPKEIRRTLGIKEGDPVEVFVNNDEIIIKKYIPSFDVKTKIKNSISSLNELSEYKNIKNEDIQNIKEYLDLALLELEKLD